MRRSGPLPSVALAVLLTASAGLPGWEPLGLSEPVLRLMAVTELKAGNNGHFVTMADINGIPITVLVDTGASAVALSFEDAQRAGLKPGSLDFSIKVATANGVTNAAKVKLRHVIIDNVKVRDVEGMVMPEGAMSGTLLGMSFLGRLRSFSMENGKLVLKN